VVGTLARDHREAFAEFLGPDVTLVPVPKSAPLPSKGSGPVLWVPRRICEALAAAGLGAAVVPGCPSIDRHIESMQARLDLPRGPITLVDDVVTKGATLFAAARVITNAFPGVEVRAFALIRTRGLVPDVERVIDPAVGTITRNRWGEAERVP
jgi:hypothetical protein